MNKKPFFLILVFLALMSMVNASTPDFSYSQSLSTSLHVGTNNVGSIVFVKQPYLPAINTLSSIVNTNAQKFDLLKWTGSLSIQVTAPDGVVSILSNNQQLQLTQSGNYQYGLLSDMNQNATLSVAVESPLTITVTSNQQNLTVNGLNTFTITGTEYSLPISLVVDQSKAVGNYPTRFTFTTANNTKSFDVTFVVMQDGNFSVFEDTLNPTIAAQSDTLTNVGYFKLLNTGNADITVSSSVTGNGSSFLQTQASQPLYKNGQTIFNFQAQIPSAQSDGQYIANVFLTSGNSSYNKSITINIRDTTQPKINNITFNHQSVLVPVTLTVDATDNILVTNATATIDGVEFNLTKDQQLFTLKGYVFNATGAHVVIVCVYDPSSNKLCKTESPSFSQLQHITANSSITLPTKRIGLTNNVQIFTLNGSAKVNFTVQLADFTSDIVGNDTFKLFKIHLQDSNNVVYPLNNITDNVTILQSNWVQLYVYTTNVTQYNGRLKFTTPDTIVPQQDILFNGVVREYNVPTSFDTTLNGKKIWSNVFDTGDYATSYQDVCQRFPLSEDESSLSIVTSIRERTIIDNRYNTTLVACENKTTFWRFTTLFSWVFVVISLLIAYYIIKIYPYARTRK